MTKELCASCENNKDVCKADVCPMEWFNNKIVKCENYIKKERQEKVNHPGHYNQSGIETIEAIKSATGNAGFEGYCVGNIVKYVSRYKYKNGLEDLKKALWHIERLITEVEKDD